MVEWGMAGGLTGKMEKYALGLFSGFSQRVAYKEAGYSSRGLPATLDRVACDLANRPHIVARLAELRAQAASNKVMDVVERKERLSEFGRGRIVDFLTENGAGIEVGKNSRNVGAVMELTTEQVAGSGELAVIKTKVKLHNPIQAIAELNKMDGVYSEPPSGDIVTVNTIVFVLPDGTKVQPAKLRENGNSDG